MGQGGFEREARLGSKSRVQGHCRGKLVSYLRLIDSCITQLKAQGPSRTCNEGKEEEEASLTPSSSTTVMVNCPPKVPSHSGRRPCERIYGLHDQHDHRRKPPAGVVVLLGSRFLSHSTRSSHHRWLGRTPPRGRTNGCPRMQCRRKAPWR